MKKITIIFSTIIIFFIGIILAGKLLEVSKSELFLSVGIVSVLSYIIYNFLTGSSMTSHINVSYGKSIYILTNELDESEKAKHVSRNFNYLHPIFKTIGILGALLLALGLIFLP